MTQINNIAANKSVAAESCHNIPYPEIPDDPNPTEPYIYTSVRYDPILKSSAQNTAASFNTPCPFYMLEHHWTRMQVAHWSTLQFWTAESNKSAPNGQSYGCGKPAEFLNSLLSAVKEWQRNHPKEASWAESLRIRRRSFASGAVTTEIWQIPRKPLSHFFPTSFSHTIDPKEAEWTVVLDSQPTEATEATMFKIHDRTPQSRARAAAGIMTLGTQKEVLLYTPSNEILDGSNSTPYFFRGGRWVTPISSSGGLQGTTRRWSLENGLCVEAAVDAGSLTEGEVIWFSNAVRGYFCAIYHLRDDAEGVDEDGVRSRKVLEDLR